MPRTPSTPPPAGGMALPNGVMMRAGGRIGVALRRADGSISVLAWPVPAARGPARVPVVRGVVAVAGVIGLGRRVMALSARVRRADARGREVVFERGRHGVRARVAGARMRPSARAVGGGVALAVGLVAAAALPAWAAARAGPGGWGVAAAGPVLQLGLAMPVMAAALRRPALRPVLGYHGAEHQAVHAHEAGAALTPDACRPLPRVHPRCGTAFAVAATLAGAVAAGLLARAPAVLQVAGALLALGVAYEAVHAMGRHRHRPLARIAARPGLAAQRLTVGEPDDGQREVACAALRAALGAAPPGGGDLSGRRRATRPARRAPWGRSRA